MAFIVVYDACVLFPAPLRDLLLRIAHAGLVRARWTEAILDECFRSLTAARPELDESALLRTRSLMNDAVPDCLVKDYEPLVAGLRLPDPDDRHVLAAAVRCGAQVIVTANLRDFPAEHLAPFPRSVPELLDTLREQGLVRSVARLREIFGGRRTLPELQSIVQSAAHRAECRA
jgi:hypothetical protein